MHKSFKKYKIIKADAEDYLSLFENTLRTDQRGNKSV